VDVTGAAFPVQKIETFDQMRSETAVVTPVVQFTKAVTDGFEKPQAALPPEVVRARRRAA
jgi:hypothetical protein